MDGAAGTSRVKVLTLAISALLVVYSGVTYLGRPGPKKVGYVLPAMVADPLWKQFASIGDGGSSVKGFSCSTKVPGDLTIVRTTTTSDEAAEPESQADVIARRAGWTLVHTRVVPDGSNPGLPSVTYHRHTSEGDITAVVYVTVEPPYASTLVLVGPDKWCKGSTAGAPAAYRDPALRRH